MSLTLPLKREYFDAIRSGQKREEFRLCTPYWTKRLAKMNRGDLMTLTCGYPAKHEHEKRITRVWNGLRVCSITHKHFGSDAVDVFAIDVTVGLAGMQEVK